ncbi:MAG: cation:proton antiporter, partial [Candidatus Micrarchaeota archaeon]
MAGDLFSEIGFLILFSAIGGALAIRFRQPAVLGLLFIGAVAGPGMLGLVNQTETITLFADIGAILLLFTIGIEFSIGNLLAGGLKVFLMAASKLALVFLLSYELALLLGLSDLAALYLGVITCITSTALFIRVAEQKGFANRDEMRILVGILIVEDVFAIFALTFFSSLGTSSEFGGIQIITSILESLAILGLAYLVLSKLLRSVFEWLARYQAAETMVFATLGLGVGLSYLAQLLGLTPSIGAFLAGSLVASLPRGKDLEKAILPFALVFSSMFFVSMGMFVNPTLLAQNAGLVIAFCVANIIFKFSGTTVSTYAFGFSSTSAVFAGLTMLPVGEFSLLVASQGAGAVGLDL